MAQVVWTQAALDDLREVHDFIAEDSAGYAQTTVDRIHAALRRLENFPRSGRLVPEPRPMPYRELLVGSYRVVYRYDEQTDRVLVLAVVHGARQLPPLSDGTA